MDPIFSGSLSIHFYDHSLHLYSVKVLVSLFRNIIKVHPSKFHPKARGGVYQFSIFSKLFLNVKISILFKTIISNRTIDHFIFPSSTNCMKHLVKHNMILSIDIPSSRVLDVCYQGIILVRKIQNISKS